MIQQIVVTALYILNDRIFRTKTTFYDTIVRFLIDNKKKSQILQLAIVELNPKYLSYRYPKQPPNLGLFYSFFPSLNMRPYFSTASIVYENNPPPGEKVNSPKKT